MIQTGITSAWSVERGAAPKIIKSTPSPCHPLGSGEEIEAPTHTKFLGTTIGKPAGGEVLKSEADTAEYRHLLIIAPTRSGSGKYLAKFGMDSIGRQTQHRPRPPLRRQARDRPPRHSRAVFEKLPVSAVRLKRDDRLHIAAPFGLADLFALRLRPNPRRFSANFSQVAAGVTRRWPEVTVEGGILERCTAAT